MSGKAGPDQQAADAYDGCDAHPVPSILDGVATIFSWDTILPVGTPDHFDRNLGRSAMNAAPLVGLFFGAIAAVLAFVLFTVSTPLLAGVILVAACQGLSRCMHIDGLADVADALGSYAPPARAREIMADPHVGAMGVTSIALTLMLQAVALAAIMQHAANVRSVLISVCAVFVISRWCTTWACRTGFSPTHINGFGGLIVGTIRRRVIAAWAVVTAAPLAVVCGPLTLLAPAAAGLATELFLRHASRRFQGLNGDCVGACAEIGATVAAIALALTAAWA